MCADDAFYHFSLIRYIRTSSKERVLQEDTTMKLGGVAQRHLNKVPLPTPLVASDSAFRAQQYSRPWNAQIEEDAIDVHGAQEDQDPAGFYKVLG